MVYVLEKRRGCKAIVKGREVTLFSSNDYLGLSSHPEVLKAAFEAAELFGTGSGGAPETTGTTAVHEQLAKAIASFKSRDEAIIFPSGYQANQAIHHSLSGKQTVFFIDRRHHPSAVDGVRLARDAKVVRFDHTDAGSLKLALESHSDTTNIVSLPSVFTIDGDIAPLDKLLGLKQQYGFVLILDEAHATGCLGKTGRGLEEHFNLIGAADFLMGTFSKALGSQGGFLAYSRQAAKHIKSEFRAFKYSTSLSPLTAKAALKSLQLLQTDHSLITFLQKAKSLLVETCKKCGIPLTVRESMIMLLPCAQPQEIQERLLDDGFLAISTKAYLDGRLTDCLRITPMATHTEDDITKFVASLKKHVTLSS